MTSLPTFGRRYYNEMVNLERAASRIMNPVLSRLACQAIGSGLRVERCSKDQL